MTGRIGTIPYHCVWISPSRPSMRGNEVSTRVARISNERAKDNGSEVLGLEIYPDHIQLCVSSPPKNSSAPLIQWFKGISTRRYTHRFKDTLHWTRSSYVGTAGTVTTGTIKQYSEAQSKT
jgi:putative transposase